VKTVSRRSQSQSSGSRRSPSSEVHGTDHQENTVLVHPSEQMRGGRGRRNMAKTDYTSRWIGRGLFFVRDPSSQRGASFISRGLKLRS
jgi:hypothetical protein